MHRFRDRSRHARWKRPFGSRSGVGAVCDLRTSMPNKSHLRVANPPPQPLLIWDGDCDFCWLWIERWREMTAGKVDYTTYQEAADRFPEVPVDEFNRSVAFIQTSGTVLFAAEAVYRSLAYRRSQEWLAWSYDHVLGFAALSETGYGLIARHRNFASAVTLLLWGQDVRRPTYVWAQRWFLRALGVIYLIAFVSLWVQVDGLFGNNGMSPVSQFLPAVRRQLGPDAYTLLPTLCWFSSSNASLHFLCGSGVLCSLLLIFGIAPAVSLVALFVLYLSLTIAGQVFFSFQWDVLLLETGFSSMFFSPWRLWPRKLSVRPGATIPATTPVSRVGLFLLKLLLFKLMLMSGMVKLTSGDDSWWNLTALDYHYWTQPLPTVLGWWSDQHAEWFKKFSVAFCLVVEIVVPFFIWAPRRLRHIAAGLLIFLQLVIAATGNYCFFNLLTIALCLLLFDDTIFMGRDAALRRPLAVQRASKIGGRRSAAFLPQNIGALTVLVMTLPINTTLIFSGFKPNAEWPRPIAMVAGYLESF